MWPLTLLALREVANILQVNRNHNDANSILSCEFNKAETNKNDKNETLKKNRNDTFAELYSEDHKFTNLFSKHIKKKKRYEIQEIAQVADYFFPIYFYALHIINIYRYAQIVPTMLIANVLLILDLEWVIWHVF